MQIIFYCYLPLSIYVCMVVLIVLVFLLYAFALSTSVHMFVCMTTYGTHYFITLAYWCFALAVGLCSYIVVAAAAAAALVRGFARLLAQEVRTLGLRCCVALRCVVCFLLPLCLHLYAEIC
ncbi:unnamed protein product [Ceratitis capitata]|uniref:(Mediterranean fruit fly) hypothetical protein n=1 Tax=Ceratitis capitata TaxID=7213 RepID=A0A811UEH3_CERCA|nr:unnamed protein product [Ceratitis capitata]